MNEQTAAKAHGIAIQNRETGTVSGVTEVLSFDEDGILLDTVMGTLAIDGEDLRITRLDLGRGEVDLAGKVNGLVYADRTARRGLFRKK